MTESFLPAIPVTRPFHVADSLQLTHRRLSITRPPWTPGIEMENGHALIDCSED